MEYQPTSFQVGAFQVSNTGTASLVIEPLELDGDGDILAPSVDSVAILSGYIIPTSLTGEIRIASLSASL